jgi:hypothetical protein
MTCLVIFGAPGFEKLLASRWCGRLWRSFGRCPSTSRTWGGNLLPPRPIPTRPRSSSSTSSPGRTEQSRGAFALLTWQVGAMTTDGGAVGQSRPPSRLVA